MVTIFIQHLLKDLTIEHPLYVPYYRHHCNSSSRIKQANDILTQIPYIQHHEFFQVLRECNHLEIDVVSACSILLQYYKDHPKEPSFLLGHINTRYERKSYIASGSYGTIYKVWDHTTHEYVAEKYYFEDVQYNEIDIMSRFDHPYLIHALEILVSPSPSTFANLNILYFILYV